jgi:hypothetical protein
MGKGRRDLWRFVIKEALFDSEAVAKPDQATQAKVTTLPCWNLITGRSPPFRRHGLLVFFWMAGSSPAKTG